MANIPSNDIEIFPSVKRNIVKSRLFTEESVANLIYNFINKNGFVIEYKHDNNYDYIRFNIGGYYFKVDHVQTNILNGIGDSITEIYAGIEIEQASGGNNNYLEVDGVDSNPDDLDNSTYNGLIIGYSEGDMSNATYWIKLFERASASSSWAIPESSWERFDTKSVGLNEVDGGTW